MKILNERIDVTTDEFVQDIVDATGGSRVPVKVNLSDDFINADNAMGKMYIDKYDKQVLMNIDFTDKVYIDVYRKDVERISVLADGAYLIYFRNKGTMMQLKLV